MWAWLQEHSHLLSTRNVTCGSPENLRGQPLVDRSSAFFCPFPLVQKIAIQDIQPHSVVVSWQSRNASGVLGYRILHQRLGAPPAPPAAGSEHALAQREDTSRPVLTAPLEPRRRSHQLDGLAADTEYRVCVVGLGDWLRAESLARLGRPAGAPPDTASPDRKCVQVRTLESAPLSVLAANLGLILGSSVGLGMVFVLCVAVVCARINKDRSRPPPKPDDVPPLPAGALALTESYPSYRHFAASSDELFETRT
ncbi:uncharacterized protein LOC122377495 [Amphibalanus amphitrite]|uniref:uncharacterized protein LOC122377495 n=1 Tax=Amphibalanus amphitrite TaxID=1232801 RepID=UPI001C91490A|nr:uncharacterized protein LOC122377495 [Amphibalanus amphitrite]